jgi:recombination protein RecR
MHSPEIQTLIQLIGKLPGLGQRSGRRIALHLLNNKEVILKNVLDALTQAYDNITTCAICGNLDTTSPCAICASSKRDAKILCIVESVADLWAIERSKTYSGYYHVLGGLLSAMDGVGPDRLHLHNLHHRIEQGVDEVILSLSATVDGQTTLHFLANQLKNFSTLKITTLSHGVPVGGELDYLDDGTLTVAFSGRRSIAA